MNSASARRRTRRLLLQWHVTERCNLRCAHCYQESWSRRDELDYPALLDILDQYRELLRWRGGNSARGHITLTGGEPFARADFCDLLEVLAGHRDSLSFAILTNGSFIDAATARRLKRLAPSFVQVSMEGRREVHDRIRGDGNFDRVVEAIRQLVRHRIRTLVSFTAHRGNYREFAHVARLARRLRVDRVWSDRLIPCGTGADLQESLLTPEETREYFELMRDARTEARRARFGRTEVAMHRALQFLVGGGKPYRCTAGDTLLTVQANGDLLPCRRLPIPVGNLRRQHLLDLYRHSDLLRALRDRERTPAACAECRWLGRCRGGLRCLAYAVTGDPFRPDPGCWYLEPAPGPPARDALRCQKTANLL